VKKRLSVIIVSLLFAALLLPSISLAQKEKSQEPKESKTSSKERPPAVPDGLRRGPRKRSMREDAQALEEDFTEALSVIQKNYVGGAKLDYNSVFKSSIGGMLRSLDPHSNYFDKAEFDEMKTEQRAEYFGIGALIANQVIGDQVETYIVATLSDRAPAYRAGLRFGDRIVEVNGESMKGRDSADVRDRIRGPLGSVVRVTVERAATRKNETVEIRRDKVPQPSIPDAYMIKPGVGYVAMTQGFNYSTSVELFAALEFLHSKGMTSLVLDLRNNPGGFLDEAIRVCDKFLQHGQLILTQRGRNEEKPVKALGESGPTDNTPMVILVNRFSASASEIVAGAMQDHDRALIVGETSFGKGLVQGIWNLESGAGLTLTSAKYYTPSDRLIQRDYSDGNLYNYFTRGGSNAQERKEEQPPVGPESRTDTGRKVYGGGGITPDEPVAAQLLTTMQVRLRTGACFDFVRELVNGRIIGFESFKITRLPDFEHDLIPADYQVSAELFNAFKRFALSNPANKYTDAQLDHSRSILAQFLRFYLVTAAYGRVTADEVTISEDLQVAKAIAVIPKARDLAMAARAAKN
jgi:carboxyl-terminal processing protease